MSKENQKGFIDLHGYKAKEALQVFLEYYNQRIQHGLKSPIEVLHGYGSHGQGGEAIKKRIRGFLSRYPLYASFETGLSLGGLFDDRTIVFPKSVLPNLDDKLSEEILAYCSNKKSEEKIFNKFRRHGDPLVRAALKRLLKSGSLVKKHDGLKFYESN